MEPIENTIYGLNAVISKNKFNIPCNIGLRIAERIVNTNMPPTTYRILEIFKASP
jgi:hypothetical protein